MFPAINRHGHRRIPAFPFDLYIDSHADHRQVQAIYYNNKFHENQEAAGTKPD